MLLRMARVLPFRPYRYSPNAGDLATLVTQPYDKIPDALREQYLEANPYNFVRLIKGQPLDGDDSAHNVYTRASETLAEWIEQGILVEDPDPGFYAYFQEFEHPETGVKTIRKGFIGLTDVEEYEKGVVHRHELTHSGPKMDRWKLSEATQCYFGQLFFLYDDPTRRIDEILDAAAVGEPLMAAREADGISVGGSVIHEVGTARMGDRAETSALNSFNQTWDAKNLFVVDGASFVSNPDKNPTLTINALSWRAGDYLAEEMRKGNV